MQCKKHSCVVLFVVLTTCCRNRVQSQLAICILPLVSDQGRSVGFVRLCRAAADLRVNGSFIFPGKQSFSVEQSLTDIVDNKHLVCS